jgi:RluA family pseudouridine synthase
MISGPKLTVEEKDRGARLDVFVQAAFPTVQRSDVRRAIEGGGIMLNGRRAAKGAKLSVGNVVEVLSLPEALDRRVRPDSSVPVSVVYDDGVLIGADKPAGIPVQPLSQDETGTLMNGLVAYAPEIAEVGDDSLMAGALHRIDTWTSGLVLASRTEEVWRAMRDLFAARKVRKTYLALVEGRVSVPGRISCELAHEPNLSFCRMVEAAKAGPRARPMFAETAYRPLHPAGAATLLEVTISTGVTHQIRAQLAMAGHPIVGDALYGAKTGLGAGHGQRLHALAVDFCHPKTGKDSRIATSAPPWAENAFID